MMMRGKLKHIILKLYKHSSSNIKVLVLTVDVEIGSIYSGMG